MDEGLRSELSKQGVFTVKFQDLYNWGRRRSVWPLQFGLACCAIAMIATTLSRYDLARFGPLLENHPIFPERANITLAHIVDRGHITIRTWERGAGLTKACGSAACATAVAAARLKRTNRTVTISLPGGDLAIEWRESDDHVLMTGTADFEYEGRFDPALFASVA